MALSLGDYSDLVHFCRSSKLVLILCILKHKAFLQLADRVQI